MLGLSSYTKLVLYQTLNLPDAVKKHLDGVLYSYQLWAGDGKFAILDKEKKPIKVVVLETDTFKVVNLSPSDKEKIRKVLMEVCIESGYPVSDSVEKASGAYQNVLPKEAASDWSTLAEDIKFVGIDFAKPSSTAVDTIFMVNTEIKKKPVVKQKEDEFVEDVVAELGDITAVARYAPVKGTAKNSTYYMVAWGKYLNVAARLHKNRVSVRIAFRKSSYSEEAEALRNQLDATFQAYDGYWSVHMDISQDVMYTRALFAVLGQLNEIDPFISPYPQVQKVRELSL